MNPPAAGLWNNPPPPGIDVEDQQSQGPTGRAPDATTRRRSRSRSHERRKSRDRSTRKRHRTRSRSRTRHRRSHSRRRSRSRSSSYDRYRRRRRHRRRSSSRSRSRSHSRRHKRHRRRSRDERASESPKPPLENDDLQDETLEEEEVEPPKENAFKNDGSFLEMFKKMQEEQQAAKTTEEQKAPDSKKPLPMFGKRRGGRVLKTGLVEKKTTVTPTETSDLQDAWSVYLKEVNRYKEACCDDDSKTRPLLK